MDEHRIDVTEPIFALIAALGFDDPRDVAELHCTPTTIVAYTFDRNANGEKHMEDGGLVLRKHTLPVRVKELSPTIEAPA